MRILLLTMSFLGVWLLQDEPAQEKPIELSPGRVEIIDRARLASDQIGVIASEIPREGTVIERGELVARLQDEVPKAALAAAEVLAGNDVEVRAKANAAEAALVEWDRAKLANSKSPGAVAELEVRRLELAHKQAVLEKEQAQKEMELYKRRRDEAAALVDSFQIKAPFRGTVTQVFRQRGEALRQGDPVLELVSIDRVRVALEISSDIQSRLKPGMKVEVRPQRNRGPALAGRISFIDVSAEPVSKTFKMHVLVEENTDNRLIPGFEAIVTIPAASAGK